MSVNKTILVGYLGGDPETHTLPDGKIVANANLATTEKWKDKTGQSQEKTEWHRLVFFGHFADIATKYLKKGSQVYIEGKLQTRKWKNKEGMDCYSTEILVRDLQMLGGKPEQAKSASTPPNADGFPDDVPF